MPLAAREDRAPFDAIFLSCLRHSSLCRHALCDKCCDAPVSRSVFGRPCRMGLGAGEPLLGVLHLMSQDILIVPKLVSSALGHVVQRSQRLLYAALYSVPVGLQASRPVLLL